MTASEQGVYYHLSDYIGVARRFFIDLVDVFVAIVVSLAISALLAFLVPEELLPLSILTAWIGVWFCYFVLLKRSRFRTLGYILAGARIVNLQGQTPSVGSLIIRFLFASLGPLNALTDLFWIPSDPCRQALRDKFAHTYVIRRGAEPAGSAPISYAQYTIFGGSFLFCEVKPVPPVPAP